MWLSDAARRALEEFMSLHGVEFQSEFAKRYAAEGRKEGIKAGIEEGQRKILIKQLTLRFGELPDGILQRIRAANDESLKRWAERIPVARTINDVFAG